VAPLRPSQQQDQRDGWVSQAKRLISPEA